MFLAFLYSFYAEKLKHMSWASVEKLPKYAVNDDISFVDNVGQAILSLVRKRVAQSRESFCESVKLGEGISLTQCS